MLNSILFKINPDDHIINISAGVHEGVLWSIWQGLTVSHQTKTVWAHCLHRIPETIPITCHQVGPAPYKEWRTFSTCFPNTAQLIRYSFMGNYCAVSGPRKHSEKKRRTYRSTFWGTLPPLAPIFHASISQILLCNKADIERLAAQLKYNESGGEPLASGVAELQRTWYLDTTWRIWMWFKGAVCSFGGKTSNHRILIFTVLMME